MNYIKSPLKQKKQKTNRRKVLSGGAPAERKQSSIFTSGSNGGKKNYGSRKKTEESPKKSVLPSFVPWKMILASFLLGACGLLYIGHVLNMQQTFSEIQQLENEFNKAQRIYNEKRLNYDRIVGPKNIYQKAREQGFINAGPADQIITTEP